MGALLLFAWAIAQAQNPSPMVERARAHERIAAAQAPAPQETIDGIVPAPVSVYVPDDFRSGASRLLVHFMGAAYIPIHAARASGTSYVVAAVHLGAGSRAFEAPLQPPGTFRRLLDGITERVSRRIGRAVTFAGVDVSAFSAGYGAVRAVLNDEDNVLTIDRLLLLDALHTGYVPDGRVLAEGGALETPKLEPFVRFARLAAEGRKTLVVTHSEIFPGTFASTTETADYLIDAVGAKRTPVLKWGPGGMQQVSEASRGRVHVLGFAGNTAPDHMDHLHGMAAFLALLR
jgi:hypothetical protein